MDGTGCGREGGVLGGEGGHGLSGLVAQRLGAGDGSGVRLQWNQVSHLELQDSRPHTSRRKHPSGGGGGGGGEGGARQWGEAGGWWKKKAGQCFIQGV